MQEEVLEMLAPGQNGVYVDATVGLGGHSEKILTLLGSGGRIIGIDKDEDALRIAGRRLSDKRVILKRGNFSDMESLLYEEGVSVVNGILFDLGVSRLQLKDPEKGFSFTPDVRLDMRMDRGQKLSAWEIVNKYPERNIEQILREFGEERLSRKIAKALVQLRHKSPVNTCAELSKIIENIYGGRGRSHPATKTFQALRIEVNKELEQLKAGLEAAIRILGTGGRLCVIAYHSLEDRIVKNFITDCFRAGLLKKITKKPRTPSLAELRLNPSSRSSKLRAAERT